MNILSQIPVQKKPNRSKRFYIHCSANAFVVMIACYYCLVINIPFIQGSFSAITSLASFSWLFLLSVPLLLLCLLIIFFSIVSVRWLLKPINYLLLIISSGVLYGSLSYGVVFDYSMIQNTFETDSSEALNYLNPQLIGFLLLFCALPVFILSKVKIHFARPHQEAISRIKLIVACCLLIALVVVNFYADYAATGRNNRILKKEIIPFQYLSSGYKYMRDQLLYTNIKFKNIDTIPTLIAPTTTSVTVIVVGETARADNFAYQGYKRNTNPYTQKHNVTYFNNVASCGTATAVSVPCMFSLQTHDNFDRLAADNQQNLIDLAQQAGSDVLWVDNNSGCKNVCTRVVNINIPTAASALCDGKYCFDEALIAPLKRKLANLSQANTVIVLHMMGSHGPTYFKRYPEKFKQFTPTCDRSDIQNCSLDELVNTYDNTIAYSDFVNAQVIDQLKALPNNIDKQFLYVSDHGESLGEAGAYLHGFPYSFAPSTQTHVPLYMWADEHNQRITNTCLANLDTRAARSHNNIFHTLLNLIGIKSKTYQASLDLLARCQTTPSEIKL
ncbi:lipid A ethanolaminephosphotransferase [Pseudoalteromonas carrageenovora]|uniref:Hydrolase n=1 Tax=Pseudoalteromonas carrageenovora IAM 12662 TaxID=1314868 RepID=A0A2K4X5J7_PSEVC|nr:phosphoethanolamine--lipid A transferase [Pseudoalteromonas carrageenovora]MBE0381787.1 phosphoethanolamine transferase [Pseudoalteromonas carrageenovora IAM 12662]QBJ70533.1 lipid A ethanolaminephosphotransferase [Pseudoalteromonas carrageenovora]GEB70647.1 phosphoethanolamine transferase [Pseudoalteromonas carrageenovora]SOU39597.1 Hydrolase [Pseudoalteromonas carrageenovora IAM 12662]